MYRPEKIRKATGGAYAPAFYHGAVGQGEYHAVGEAGAWRVGFSGQNDDGSSYRWPEIAGPFEDREEAEALADDMNADRRRYAEWFQGLTSADRQYLDSL